MQPWVQLDQAPIPGGGEMSLWQHVRDFAIRVGRDELMNSETHGSEEAVADLACAKVLAASGNREDLRILVGGLGMGYSAAAALRHIGPQGQMMIAELVPAVVDWNRQYLGHLADNPLQDPRVQVHVGDIQHLFRPNKPTYDVIILDVDNGPQALTSADNHWLYGHNGLKRIHATLRPNGVVSVWSTGPDEAFTARLKKNGFLPEVHSVAARGRRGRKHTIWVAGKRG